MSPTNGVWKGAKGDEPKILLGGRGGGKLWGLGQEGVKKKFKKWENYLPGSKKKGC